MIAVSSGVDMMVWIGVLPASSSVTDKRPRFRLRKSYCLLLRSRSLHHRVIPNRSRIHPLAVGVIVAHENSSKNRRADWDYGQRESEGDCTLIGQDTTGASGGTRRSVQLATTAPNPSIIAKLTAHACNANRLQTTQMCSIFFLSPSLALFSSVKFSDFGTVTFFVYLW